jgi:hypothetical protein
MTTPEVKQINPWTGIWSFPRQTMQYILDTNQKSTIVLLAILNGIVGAINWMVAISNTESDVSNYFSAFVVTLILVFGVIFGIIHLYLGAWLLKVAGRWIKGIGNFSEVKCAVGWSCYPMIVASIFNILSNLSLKGPYILTLLLALLSIVFTIYAFIIALKLIAQAHKFSAWKALLAYLLIFVIVFVVFMLLIMFIPLLQPLFKA